MFNINLSFKKINFSFFNYTFLGSKYFHFFIPSLYFVIMLFVTMTNHKIGDYGVETDFYVAYFPQAYELLNGNLIIDQYRGPMYQIVLAITGFFFNFNFFEAGKFLNVLCAAMTLYFVSKIISSVLSREGAVLTVLLLGVNTVFLRYTYEAGTDMLFLVFYTSSLYFILKDKKSGDKNFLAAGILSSLAYLTRYTGISLIIFVALIFIIQFLKNYYRKNSFDKSFLLKQLAFYFIPVIIFISVWSIICFQKTGYFFYNMNFQNTAFTIYKPENISKDEWIYQNQNTFKSMSDVILKDPVAFTKTIFLKNFVSYFIKDITRLFPFYIGLFAAFGLMLFILKFKSQKKSEIYFFLANLIFYFQILLIFYAERFSMPLLPFFCYLIIKLFSFDFLQKFNFQVSGLKFFGVLILSLIFLNFYDSYKITKERINSGPVEILSIKEKTRNNSMELTGKTIMARKPHIAYTLDMKYIVIPFSENYNELLKNVKTNNADYLFVSEKEGDFFTNQNLKQNLFDTNATPVELELITHTSNPLTILYKVKK